MNEARASAMLVIVAAVGWASTAVADDRDPAAAEALFQQARTALAAGKTEVACSKFRESERLDPSPGTLLNVADCEERLNHLAAAWELFHEVDEQPAADASFRKEAKHRAGLLDPKLPHVTARLDPSAADAVIKRDGIVVGKASLDTALPIDPGTHSFTVDLAGHRLATIPFTIAAGEMKTVILVAGAVDPEAGKAASKPPTSAQPSTPSAPVRSWQAPVGIAAMVVGGAALGAGGVFGGLALLKKNESNKTDCNAVTNGCSDVGLSLRRQAIRFGNASTGLMVAGAIVATVGIVVFATAPHARAGQKSAWITVGPLGLDLKGRFE